MGLLGWLLPGVQGLALVFRGEGCVFQGCALSVQVACFMVACFGLSCQTARL